MSLQSSARPAVHSIRFRCSGVLFGLSPFFLALWWLVGCPSPHPTIQVTNQLNETGGTLQISGSGFLMGDPVTLKIENVPGLGTWSSSAGNATQAGGKLPYGSINVTVTYSLNPSSTLPGCPSGNRPGYYATLSVTATGHEDDGSSYDTSPAQLQVINCGWLSAQVTAHQ